MSLSQVIPSVTGIPITLLVVYLSYVRYCRYKRLKELEAKYNSTWKQGGLSPEQAQEILHCSLFYDNPLILRLGTQSALFKVYALPSFANLLVKTGQLKSPETISKRIADAWTATLIASWLTYPLMQFPANGADVDPRGAIAVARVNYLHGKYKIANQDFLYNLALFINEPASWITRYDWRPLTEMECDAIFIFWKEIGHRMGIQNIWENRQDMLAWIQIYEEEHIVPSANARILANTTLSFFLRRFPHAFGIRFFFKNIALSLLEERFRLAMGLPTPHIAFPYFVFMVLKLRAIFVLHFCLPRRCKSLFVTLKPADNANSSGVPRMHATYRRPIPWYWPESQGLRRQWERLLVALRLIDSATLPGPKWKSEGYRLEELGPMEFENSGKREVLQAAQKMQGYSLTGSWAFES